MLRALVREKPIGEQRDRTNLASPWAKSWLYERKPSTVLFWLMVVYPFAWSSTRFRVAKEIFPVAAKFSHVSYGSMRQIIGQICSSMETVKPGLAGGGGVWPVHGMDHTKGGAGDAGHLPRAGGVRVGHLRCAHGQRQRPV